jgi:CRP/FNR family transcriptional regulator
VFLLRAGKVKLSTASNGGRSLVARLALPGEVVGLSATVRGKPYEVTAETVGPSEVDF